MTIAISARMPPTCMRLPAMNDVAISSPASTIEALGRMPPLRASVIAFAASLFENSGPGQQGLTISAVANVAPAGSADPMRACATGDNQVFSTSAAALIDSFRGISTRIQPQALRPVAQVAPRPTG